MRTSGRFSTSFIMARSTGSGRAPNTFEFSVCTLTLFNAKSPVAAAENSFHGESLYCYSSASVRHFQ